MTREPFVYLSLGAGVQSTALLALSGRGDRCPVADVAIFADTQQEPAHVYTHLARLRDLSPIPIVTVTTGDLGRDSIGGHLMRLPAFTAGGGIALRQCTHKYKIVPIQRWVREHLGYAPRQRVRHAVTSLVGISVDEIARAKPSPDKWVTRRHPLIDADLRRRDCVALLERLGWPVPEKSACVFCPYHDDATWRELRDEHPDDFARAVAFDAAIRTSSKAGASRPVYLHKSLQPLADVEFKPAHATPLFDSFTDECEGMCGV